MERKRKKSRNSRRVSPFYHIKFCELCTQGWRVKTYSERGVVLQKGEELLLVDWNGNEESIA